MASKYLYSWKQFIFSQCHLLFSKTRKFDNFLRGPFEMRNHHIILKSYTCTLTAEARGQAKKPPNFGGLFIAKVTRHFLLVWKDTFLKILIHILLGLKTYSLKVRNRETISLKYWMLLKWF